MEKALEILNSFIKDKKVDYTKIDSWSYDNKYKIKEGSFREGLGQNDNIGPYSKEEVWNDLRNSDKLKLDIIPEKFYNKTFNLGEFEVTVQHNLDRKLKDNGYGPSSLGYQGVYFDINEYLYIFMNYHGVFIKLGDLIRSYTIRAADCKPTQSNWSWLKPTEEKPYILENYTLYLDGGYNSKLIQLFKLIDDVELVDNKYEFQDRYDFINKSKSKDLVDYTRENIDFEFLIKQEIKKDVYTPESLTINKLLFAWTDNTYNLKYPKHHDFKILQKLGVKTIHLRTDAHFNLKLLFDLKGLHIKAPQKVIERYNYEKYCIDKDLVAKIKKEEEASIRESKLVEYNNQFTLMQHGKVIFKNINKDDIIEFLENFSVSNLDSEIIKCVEPIFIAFPNIKKINLVAWGTYYKYESAGTRYMHTEDLDNSHIDSDILNNIEQLYYSNLEIPIDERSLEIKYGYEEQGGTLLGVEKTKTGKLKIFTEEYDPE